jgi:hypothetical protein
MQVVSAIMENYEISITDEDSDGNVKAYEYSMSEVVGDVGRPIVTDVFIRLPKEEFFSG